MIQRDGTLLIVLSLGTQKIFYDPWHAQLFVLIVKNKETKHEKIEIPLMVMDATITVLLKIIMYVKEILK